MDGAFFIAVNYRRRVVTSQIRLIPKNTASNFQLAPFGGITTAEHCKGARFTRALLVYRARPANSRLHLFVLIWELGEIQRRLGLV